MLPKDFQPFEESTDSPASPDVKRILSTLFERLWVIGLCVALGAVGTIAYLARAPRIYEASTVIKVDPNQPRILDLPGIIQEDYRGPMLEPKLKEIKQTLLSRTLLVSVVETNKLATDPRFLSPLPDTPPDKSRLAVRLSRMIDVALPKDNGLITVTVGSQNPELAAQLANSLASELIRQNTESKEELLNKVEAKLREMAQSLRKEREAQEQVLQPYREKSASLASQHEDMVLELREANQKLTEASFRRLRLEADYSEVQKLGTNVDALLRLPSISADPGVIAARTGLSQKQLAFDNLKRRYKSKHPKYIEAENETAGAARMLATAVLDASQSVQSAIESSKTTEQALQKQFDDLQNAARNVNMKLNESTNNFLTREIELERTIHDKVVQRLKEASLTSDLFYHPITVFQAAEVPLRPSKPNQIKISVAGILGSFILGVVLVLALGLVDTSLKSLEETEQTMNLPVLSTIPRIRSLAPGRSQIVMNEVGVASGAESFRCLRTSISVLGKDKELRSILFTSALPAEGKTFCALNYAVSLAQQGLKTVLIDCDLRRPLLTESVPCEKRDGPGLAEYLRLQVGNTEPKYSPKAQRTDADLSFSELRTKRRGEGTSSQGAKPASTQRESSVSVEPLSSESVIQKTETENLYFVAAGKAVANPSELLAQPALGQLLSELLRKYDRVVVDSAPIFGVSDTMLIANRVHGVCLVIRANRTPRKAATRAVEMLQRIEAHILGVALNGHVTSRLGGYAADPYYDYGYESRKVSERT